LALPSYLLLVRSLRWRRFNAIHREFAARDPESLTTAEAQRVMHTVTMWDMPFLNVKSLAFALFKTYAIPSISKILAGTGELSSSERVSKRYADTEILIATWMNCPVMGNYPLSTTGQNAEDKDFDPRAMIAVARVNFLHSHYPIKNDDHLYTLSLFVFEPPRWAARYGWRPWSVLERTALFIVWREIGARMGIADIPETMGEFEAWSLAYEQEYMVPADTNAFVAQYTTDELLHSVPAFLGLRAAAERVVVCTLEERVRIAMKQPAQPAWLKALTHYLILASGVFQRHLCLPRRFSHQLFSVGADGVPRMHPNEFRARPWYKPAGARWLDRAKVLLGWYDAVPGEQWAAGGYRLEEVVSGPGHEQVMRDAARLQGCPV
ncbi:hypothetical protein FIBSPDRAFT_668589, partial [Athelia psychrophila]